MNDSQQICAALRQELSEKFGAVCWIEDDEGLRYRLVLAMAPTRIANHLEQRALRYADILMADSIITVCAQNRQSMRVDCMVPGSIEILEKFIEENCTKRFRPRSSIGLST